MCVQTSIFTKKIISADVETSFSSGNKKCKFFLLLFLCFKTTITSTRHRRRSETRIEKKIASCFSWLSFSFLSYRATETSNNNSFLRLRLFLFLVSATCSCEQNMRSPSSAAVTAVKVAFPSPSHFLDFSAPKRKKLVQTSSYSLR